MNESFPDPSPALGLRRYVWALVTVWTLIVAASLAWNLHEEWAETLEQARTQARVAFEKDVLYRRWNADHGGVYVPVTEATPPNPYLLAADRDVRTSSGRLLTLVNPAYFSRQIYEMGASESGALGHLASLKPLYQGNAADPWESKALRAFERGTMEVSSLEPLNGQPYLRLMRPLSVEKACLKCHATRGYREGDVLGGISVSVPMTPLLAIARPQKWTLVGAHGFLWLLGLVGIGAGAWGMKQRISERLRVEEALQQSEERYRTMIHNLPLGLYRRTPGPQGRFVMVNPAHARIFGYESVEEFLGTTVSDRYVDPAECKAFSGRLIAEGSVSRVALRLKKKDGTPIWGAVSARVVRGPTGEIEFFDGAIEDITELHRAEQALRTLSLMDDLTGLDNRRGFLLLAEQQLKLADRTKKGLLLVFCGLDGLKSTNDNLGHAEGDQVLIATAQVLKSTFRESDIIGRIAGDEFAVLAVEASSAGPEALAARLQESVEAFNAKGHRPWKLSLSVGIARYDPESPCSLDALLSRADSLMYEHKRSKRGGMTTRLPRGGSCHEQIRNCHGVGDLGFCGLDLAVRSGSSARTLRHSRWARGHRRKKGARNRQRQSRSDLGAEEGRGGNQEGVRENSRGPQARSRGRGTCRHVFLRNARSDSSRGRRSALHRPETRRRRPRACHSGRRQGAGDG